MKNQKFRDELKSIASKDINEFFEDYAKRILSNSTESNLIIALEGRYRELKNQEIKGVISNEEFNREMNKIRASLIDLIDKIDSSHYIPNLDSKEVSQIILQLNQSSLKSEELISKQGKEIESLGHKMSSLHYEIDKLRMKLLERSILSIDTQDANLESNFISDYIQICLKYNNSLVKHEVDRILEAVLKYSKRYPDLIDYEKSMIIEGLTKLNLDVINKKKLDSIMENFKLK